MRRYRTEAERLSAASSLVGRRFPRFGVNKKREITRLLYEISKRENVSPADVLRRMARSDFKGLKERLLRERYPHASPAERARAFFTALSLDPSLRVSGGEGAFWPKSVVVEEKAAGSRLAQRVRDTFPAATLTVTPRLGEHLSRSGMYGIAAYNRRRDTLFITRERHDFFKPCPCTKGAIPCGYHIFNLGFGCIYDCAYCYLQHYANAPGIVLPANVEDFFGAFARYRESPSAMAWQRGRRMRIGTGEFSDSLMLDHLTEYSLPIVEFFKGQKDTLVEFKTKSANVGNLLRAPHGGNIIVSWSLNPQRIIDEAEWGAVALEERIGAAARCAGAGYKVGFHFDPIFHFAGWGKEYGTVIDLLYGSIKPDDIGWVSLGTFRFTPDLKRIIENRFPENRILDTELLPGFDGKLRYPRGVRHEIYRTLAQMLLKHSRAVPIYLCMEDRGMWDDTGIRSPFI